MGGLYSVLVATKETQTQIREISSCPITSTGILAGGQAICFRFTLDGTTFTALNTQ